MRSGCSAVVPASSVLNAAVLRPLPFPDPDRLVFVYEVDPQEGVRRNPRPGTIQVWNDESQLMEGVAGVAGVAQFALAGERVNFGQVDLQTLRLLGVTPILGRWHDSDDAIGDDGVSARTIVISYGLWQRLFGGDPNVLGQTLPGWTAGWGETVVGVMPPGFWVAPFWADADAWYAWDSRRMRPGDRRPAIGRLKPDVSLEQAASELQAILRTSPDTADWTIELLPAHDDFSAEYADSLYLLLGAVAFVLLIGCANVVNLQLSQTMSRQTELATRAALGAGRLRLVRQLLSENVLLALMGGTLGILVALVGVRIFLMLAPDFYPVTEEITIDTTVLLFALGLSVTSGLLVAVSPAFGSSRLDLQTALNQSARVASGGQGVRRVLVVSEVALSLVLLVGAGLTINSYARLISVDPGFDPDDVLVARTSLGGMDRYRVAHDLRADYEMLPAAEMFYTDVLDRLAALPGVTSVGMITRLPPDETADRPFRIVGGRQVDDFFALYHEVNPDFFGTMRIPLLQGRFFSDLDRETGPAVAIVNEAAVRTYFSGKGALGRIVQVGLNRSNPDLDEDPPREIVGVVGDTRARPQGEVVPTIFVPYRQHLAHYAGNGVASAHFFKDFAIRTEGASVGTLTARIRREVAEVDPDVAVEEMMPMRERLSGSIASEAFLMRLLGTFAGLGLFLAAIGVYGVVSFAALKRTNEFGVRTALGAERSDIRRLVIREGLWLTLMGVGIGVLAAFGLTRLIASQLFGVRPMDPATIAAVVVVLTGVTLVASYIPARRATRVSPLVALRHE